MKTCKMTRKQMEDQVALGKNPSREVSSHMENCPDCTAFLEKEKSFNALLKTPAAPLQVSSPLHQKILTSAQQGITERDNNKELQQFSAGNKPEIQVAYAKRWTIFSYFLASAAALVALGFITWFSASPGEQPVPIFSSFMQATQDHITAPYQTEVTALTQNLRQATEFITGLIPVSPSSDSSS